MDSDLNKYDLDHRVSHHPRMSDGEWEDAYRAAWSAYYTPDHVRTILRRVAANKRGRPETTLSTILWFYLMIAFEGVHPLEGGAFRLKFRRDRRPRKSLDLLSALSFGDRGEGLALLVDLPAVQQDTEGLKAPDRWTYSDLAIAPPREEELDSLELYKATRGGEMAVAKKRKEDARQCARLRPGRWAVRPQRSDDRHNSKRASQVWFGSEAEIPGTVRFVPEAEYYAIDLRASKSRRRP